jgi:hypothetical protein
LIDISKRGYLTSFLGKEAVNILDSWALLLIIKSLSKHCVGLARACLPISKNGTIETLNHFAYAFLNVVEKV